MPVFCWAGDNISSPYIDGLRKNIFYIFNKREIIYLTTMKIYSKKYLTFHSLYAIINASNKGGFQYETYSIM